MIVHLAEKRRAAVVEGFGQSPFGVQLHNAERSTTTRLTRRGTAI